MSYQVLALKYRPQTFDEVVGQQHVTATLSNAISSDRVAHAILFTGPRGTGKTTIARILAKAMNCENGPSPTPCNTCKICTDIIDGHCTDVFEIDGASNNSVDQIRDLRENVTYMPSSARHKIYIIDEVHMLSTAAFNALLKTLEEPPDHVMFIFATTEVHKIPATILSRCQRHDLGRIDLAAITSHLDRLCRHEDFKVEEGSLELVAREADGSIRDSLSLLDRVLSSSVKPQIEYQDILDGLGILDQRMLHEISSAVFRQDGQALIQSIETVNNSGIDLKKYYSDLVGHFRNLSVIRICGEKSPAVDIPEAEKQIFFKETAGFAPGYITRILQSLLDDEALVRYASQTRTAVELALLKLLEIDPGRQIDQILSRLDNLARKMGPPGSGAPQANDPTGIPHEPPPPVHQNEMQHSSGNQAPAHGGPVPIAAPSSTRQHEKHQPPAAAPQQSLEPGSRVQTAPAARSWADFLKKVEKTYPFFHALLLKASVSEKNPDEVTVGFKDCSAFEQKRIKEKQTLLVELCKEFLGKNMIIQVASKDPLPSAGAGKQTETKAKHAALNHPLVVEAQKKFNGRIMNI